MLDLTTVSERRACRLAGLSRDAFRHEPAPTPATQALLAAWQSIDSANDVPAVAAALRTLVAPINTFFDKVMVMAEDETLRRARLSLLQAIAALPDGTADLSKLQGF